MPHRQAPAGHTTKVLFSILRPALLFPFSRSSVPASPQFSPRKEGYASPLSKAGFRIRSAPGDKYVLVNGEYYAHLPDSFEPENAFDAFMRFFAISNNQKLEEFVHKNYHHFDFLKNLLERQKKFFENPDDVKIYMDREFELKELQARDEAIRKANDRAEKAEAEIKARDEEIAKIKGEADKAKAELALAKAEIEKLKAGKKD